jgi:dihydrodipicolinate synthase/N-acetylneuraminate lyase
MNTNSITPEILAGSVVSVPPLARNADGSLSRSENEKIVQHLAAGGVSTVLYGGNAILYHVALSEYEQLLILLAQIATDHTLMIPSVGPGYGTMMDQANILKDFSFPTAMILPTRDVVTPQGVARAVRQFVNAIDRPAVLYIKNDGYVDIDTASGLMRDGVISWIKYAVVREDTSNDPFLADLVQAVGSDLIVSGIGEQPAITHLRDFGLTGFTSGCVCVAPGLSMKMLHAIKAGDFETAEQIRSVFEPLENERNRINPIRVLHTALALAGIAQTGPLIPLLSEIPESEWAAVGDAAKNLLAADSKS